MIEILKATGCIEVGFGAESASQKILDIVQKRTTVEQMHNLCHRFLSAGIKVKSFFMIGLPGESEEDARQTETFIRRWFRKYPDMYGYDLCAFFPYRGTLIGDSIRRKEDAYDLRLIEGLSWPEVDTGEYGAYKKVGGDSDLIIETYDWKSKQVLLSAKRIQAIKNNLSLRRGL